MTQFMVERNDMRQMSYIVGNKFSQFATNNNVITAGQFKQMLTVTSIGKSRQNDYVLAQGLSAEAIQELRQLLTVHNIQQISLSETAFEREQSRFVHKVEEDNVLIAKPIAINNSLYVSQLQLNDACAEMQDHVTGQHVQGIVLIEAARQMMLSISEHYLLPKTQQFKGYFVLNRVDTRFSQFVFPLDCEISCDVIKAQLNQRGDLKSELAIDFIQNGEVKSTVNIEYAVFDKAWLQEKENNLAKTFVAQTLENDWQMQMAEKQSFIGA